MFCPSLRVSSLRSLRDRSSFETTQSLHKEQDDKKTLVRVCYFVLFPALCHAVIGMKRKYGVYGRGDKCQGAGGDASGVRRTRGVLASKRGIHSCGNCTEEQEVMRRVRQAEPLQDE